MKCTNCRREVPNTAKVCGHCGHKLKAVASAPVQGITTEHTPVHGVIPGWVWGVGGFSLVLIFLGYKILGSSSVPVQPESAQSALSNSVVEPALIVESTVVPTTEAPSDVRILLNDDFSNLSSGWTTGSDGNVDGSYDNGRYRMSLTGKYSWYYMQYLEGDPQGNFDDFTVEIDITPVSPGGGPAGEIVNDGYAGLVFRRSAPYNFYVFQISPYGWFSLLRADQAERESWTALHLWSSPDIIFTNNHVNRLKITASGDKISLYINDQFLTSVQDGTYKSGWMGLYVARSSENIAKGLTADYFFDNLKITYP